MVRQFVADALDRDGSGRYEPADVQAALLNGTARLWVSWNEEQKAVEAAVITEIIDFPRLRELRIWLIAGRNMKAWAKEGLVMLEEFGRAQGCTMASGGLRRGWARIGAAATGGWRESGVTLEKRL